MLWMLSGEAAGSTEQRTNELTLHLCFKGGIRTASAVFCCSLFCGPVSHSATYFHQPFKSLLIPLVVLKFDWN